MDAVLHSITCLPSSIHDLCIRLLCDNSVVVSAIRNNYSSNANMRFKLTQLFGALQARSCSIIASHIPGTTNTVADTLSRVSLEDSYRFRREILHIIEMAFEPITIDRFATRANRVH